MQLLGELEPTKYNGRAKDARPNNGTAWRGWGKAITRFLAFLLSLAYTITGQCQVNLVLNGSFEERIGCTVSNTVSSLLYCQDWEGLHGSPDYFHQCASTAPWWSVPDNVFGTQLPSNTTDSAYAGISTFTTLFPGGQESLEGLLSEPLLAGVKYRVRMKAAIADSNNNYTSCCVGIAFSPPPFPPYTENLCDVELRIPADAIDLSVWYQLDTIYTAQGGEQEFYIGNFRPDDESYPVVIGDTSEWQTNIAYFFIDDVEIYEDTLTSIEEELPMIEDRIRVYPNPSTGMLVVDIKMAESNDQSMSLKVTDLSGKTVYQSSMQVGMNRMELTLAPSSYLYSINGASGATLQNGKLVIVQ